jgi:hypothetical protein
MVKSRLAELPLTVVLEGVFMDLVMSVGNTDFTEDDPTETTDAELVSTAKQRLLPYAERSARPDCPGNERKPSP